MPAVMSNGESLDGRDQSKHISQDPHDLPSLLLSCFPVTLKFIDLHFQVKIEKKKSRRGLRELLKTHNDRREKGSSTENDRRTILNGVSGMVSPGEILTILGPSGSGKSTLLNILAGRSTHNKNKTNFSGTILFNDQNPTKHFTRKTGFVTQDDVLYPHLTVRETLIFCSLLRLPKTLTKKEKTSIAEAVIVQLGLTKCQNTIIGNNFIRGVSGGERKRVSIGHEMLINPSLLILDEPTSGLDSTAAHRLMVTLVGLAEKGKTIVTSMHQPSSRVYQMFSKVLVLSEGKCLYFGQGCDAMDYVESVGFRPAFPVNPADFLLDLASGHASHVDGLSETDKPNVHQSLVASYNALLAPQLKAAFLETAIATDSAKESYLDRSLKDRRGSRKLETSATWFDQFTILLRRGLKERKHEAFDTLRVIQVITAAFVAGLMWWHSDYRDVQDRLGLYFFMSIFWGVLPSFNSVFAFTQERAIFLKERASGMYTLSSYFLARIVGDLPMELILPTIFLVITYWMTGSDFYAFLLTLILLHGYVLVSQGLGLALGAAIMDAKQASTMITIIMLVFILNGGYYVHNLPSWMAWIKYTSTTFYSYRLLINIQYGNGEKLFSQLGCSHDHAPLATCKFIKQDVIDQISPVVSVGVLIVMFVVYRLFAYLLLRRIKT